MNQKGTEVLGCLYFGQPDQCPECGGLSETGSRFCSHECGANHAERAAFILSERDRRRRQDDEFAVAADSLRQEGRTDEEIDVILKGMP